MTLDSSRPVLLRTDFDRCFVDEPDEVAPASVLHAARRSVRRRRLLLSVVAAVAAIVIGLTALNNQQFTSLLELRPDTAVPSPPSVASQPALPRPRGRDVAPKLVWSARDGYRDRAGLTAVETGNPFTLTSTALRTVISQQLDPAGQHLTDNGSSLERADGATQIGQVFHSRIPHEAGEGEVKVAVTRLAPDAQADLRSNKTGLCLETHADCQPEIIAGTQVWTADLPLGGFVMDLVQQDGEVGAIIVRNRAKDSTAPVSRLLVSPEQAVTLLLNHQLDIVG